MLTWVARRTKGSRPTCRDAIGGAERLGYGEPASAPLTLVLKFQEVGNVAMQAFVDGTHNRFTWQRVLDPDLTGIFIRDIRIEVGRRRIGVFARQIVGMG